MTLKITRVKCDESTSSCLLSQNRFDLKRKTSFIPKIAKENSVLALIPAYKSSFKLYLGVYLQHYDFNFEELVVLLFTKWRLVRKIVIHHLVNPIRSAREQLNFSVILPESPDAWILTLKGKLGSNLRYYRKQLTQCHKMNFYEFKTISEEMVETYLDWKNRTHGFTFEGRPLKFISDYLITHCFTIGLSEQQPAAILFISRSSETAFLENFAYDQVWQKYSPGKVLLYLTIDHLIKSKVKRLILGGGDPGSYKSQFANQIQKTYSGTLLRKDFVGYDALSIFGI